MPRRSLKPELNKIRAWVRQGRTDAWIAHQLEVTVQQIEAFKRDQRLDADDGDANGATPDYDDDLDLRAEDDAMIAAELDAAAAEAAERRGRGRAPPPRPPSEDETTTSRAAGAAAAAVVAAVPAPPAAGGDVRPRRGGLRPVARPGRPGRPDLRRVLGRPSARRGRDRGGPDHHPPCRLETDGDGDGDADAD